MTRSKWCDLTLPAGSSHTGCSAWLDLEPELQGCRSHGPLSGKQNEIHGKHQSHYSFIQFPWSKTETVNANNQAGRRFVRYHTTLRCCRIVNLQDWSSVLEMGLLCSDRCDQTWTELPLESASDDSPKANLHKWRTYQFKQGFKIRNSTFRIPVLPMRLWLITWHCWDGSVWRGTV